MAIAMTAWKRPEYLTRTLDSWERARGLGLVPYRRVFPDKSTPEMEHTMSCLSLEHGWDVSVRDWHHGVLVNPVESVSAMFRDHEEVDFVILAEDDVVVAQDVLEFFTWAQRFRDDQGVGVVCAHRPQETGVPQERLGAVVKMLGFSCPLVWGTWRDRWEGFIAPTWDRDYRAQGWDYNLLRLMRLSGRHSVFPEWNRSDHIGENGGVHCTAAYWEHTVDPKFYEEIPPQSYEIVEGPEWTGNG